MESNLWGRLFLSKRFREKEVLFARFNRQLTLKVLRVNPVKLRQRRLSLGGQCLVESLRFKRFHFNIREHQFRKLVGYAVRKPANFRKPSYAQDILVTLLESRLDTLLSRTGLFPTPQMVRQLISYREIMVDGVCG